MQVAIERLSDPDSTNALGDAVFWLQSTLTGYLATVIAIISVAAIGLIMLRGRIDTRRAITVMLGCFIVFGAQTIATSLTSLDKSQNGLGRQKAALATPATISSEPQAASADLYTSASVPDGR